MARKRSAEVDAWVRRGVGRNTVFRWQQEGAPIGDPQAMLEWWQANRRNRPRQEILDAVDEVAQGGVSATAAAAPSPERPAGSEKLAAMERITLSDRPADLGALSLDLRAWIATCQHNMQVWAEKGNMANVTRWRKLQHEAIEEWRRLAKEMPKILIEEGRALDREEVVEAVARVSGQMLAALRSIPRRLRMGEEMGNLVQKELDRIFEAWHETGLAA